MRGFAKAASVLVRKKRPGLPDLFLVVARTPEGKAWCPPGGKVEGDERAPRAAARELLEETGLTVHPADLRFVMSGEHATPSWRGEVFVFFCESWQAKGTGNFAGECPIKWMTWEEVCSDVFGEFYKGADLGRFA